MFLEAITGPMIATCGFTIFTIGVTFYYFVLPWWRSRPRMPEEFNLIEPEVSKEDSQTRRKSETKQSRKFVDLSKRKDPISHKYILATLKGHAANVTGIDWASDGKKLVAVSEDSTIHVHIFKSGDIGSRDVLRQKLEFDTATHVKCTLDCVSFIVSMKRDNKIQKNEGGVKKIVLSDKVQFPKCHTQDISSIGIACTGKFIMSASPDNKVVLYNIKGDVIAQPNISVNTIHDCRVSPSGERQFVTVCGFPPDVFIFEAKFGRDDKFELKKTFSLSGHKSSVIACAFDQLNEYAATISKDGYVRVFDIESCVNSGFDPKLHSEFYWEPLLKVDPTKVRLAISPHGGAIAVAVGRTLKMFATLDLPMDFGQIDDLHVSPIVSLEFSSCSKYLATCGDKYVYILDNVAESRSSIVKNSAKLVYVPEPRNSVLVEEIQSHQKKLKKYGLATDE